MATFTLKKISELLAASDYNGLWTIGVDSQNRSVKISLSWMYTTKTAMEEATTAANNAATNANTKAGLANDAAALANQKAAAANTAAQNANDKAALVQQRLDTADADHTRAEQDHDAAAGDHTRAGTDHQTASDDHTQAGSDHERAGNDHTRAEGDHSTAGDDHSTATGDHNTATGDHDTAAADHTASELATAAAIAATEDAEDIIERLGTLTPTGMSLEYPERITLGNLRDHFIKATLTPAGSGKNILYLADGKAIDTDPDGRINVIAPGWSRVHVIPTLNTALYRTIQIQVSRPTMRLVTSASMRFLGSGALRLT